MSAISEGIRLSGQPTRPRPRARMPGLLDLFLVAAVAVAVGARTPVGGLMRFGADWLLGHDPSTPSLTAYFETGASVTELPALPTLPQVGEASAEEGAHQGLVEPYRSAAAAVVGSPRISELDTLIEGHTVEGALERLAVGDALRDRAIARARATGTGQPERYGQHRSFLPAGARAEADRVVHGTLAVATALDLAWPVADHHPVTSGYGERDHPILSKRSFHNGIDIGVPVGTAVRAPQDGVVRVISSNAASGRYLVVDHGHGVRTTFCHLSDSVVAVGDRVKRGDHLAQSGNTGRSTGPHLHYIVRVGGDTKDPAPLRRPHAREPVRG
jgi:murein DD-endopeptidase